MASSSLACSIDDCKRAAKCLCHHCNKNVCSRHFTEHQLQINNELVPLTDRLNERKQFDFCDCAIGSFAFLII